MKPLFPVAPMVGLPDLNQAGQTHRMRGTKDRKLRLDRGDTTADFADRDQPGGPPWPTAIGYMALAVVLGTFGCADIWGFDELKNSSGGGSGGSTMIIQIGSGGTTGEIGTGGSGIGGAGAPGAGGGASSGGAGGRGTGGAAGAAGTGGVRGGGGASGMGGVTGAGGAAGMAGAGGVRGIGGAAGVGGAAGGAAPGVGGAIGTGGGPGAGGAVGAGGTGGAASCGPSNCTNGCCAAGSCITATTAQQCGARGSVCTVCGGCQACGPGGACAIDPASNWMVRCASAALTTAPPTGATWDPAGVAGDGPAPDPFCQFERPAGVIDSATGAATRTINDSFTATWNQTVTAGTSTITAADLMSANAATWRVWVGDSEFTGRGTLACEVRPPLPATALLNGQLTVANVQNCVSLTLTLVCRP